MNDGLQQPQTPMQPPQEPENIFLAMPPLKKKPSKGLIALIITLSVLLLVGIGAALYFLFFQPQPNDDKSTTEISEAAGKSEEYIEKVRSAISVQLTPTYPLLVIKDKTGAPVYTAPDTSYAVFSDEFGLGLVINAGTETQSAEGQLEIERIAKETLAAESSLEVTQQPTYIEYQSAAVICTVSTGISPSVVKCAETKDYTNLITEVKLLATAYLESEEGQKNDRTIAFSTPEFAEKSNGISSATVPLRTIGTSISNATGLFHARDGIWTYWKSAQGTLACTDYNTNTLQRAFEGKPCIDAASKEAFVTVTL